MKKLTSLIMIIFFVLSLAGCGSPQANTATAKSEIETKAIEPVKEDSNTSPSFTL